MFFVILCGFPFVANKQSSTFPIVHRPKFDTGLPFLYFLLQTNAIVLYLKPHASITCRASGIKGDTAHRKRTQSLSAILPTERDFIHSNPCVSYSWSSEKLCPDILSS